LAQAILLAESRVLFKQEAKQADHHQTC